MGFIHVYLCSDDNLLASRMMQVFEAVPDIRLLSTASSIGELEKRLRTRACEVLLLDAMQAGPAVRGLEGALYLSRKYADIPIIILAGEHEDSVVEEALGVGGAVNVLQKAYLHDLPDAVRSAANRKSGIHYATAEVLRRQLSKRKADDVRRQLSDTQLAILRMLNQGFSRKEIAKTLYFNEQTISNELCKATAAIKSTFPYLEWLRIKKNKTKEVVELAKEITII